MRHEPTANELSYLDKMDDEERLYYFITRTMESEEVWRLCDADDWVCREQDGVMVMQLWPYQGLAEPFARKGEATDAVSLEHFVFHELEALHAEGVRVEVFPGGLLLDGLIQNKKPGKQMSAAELFHIFDHKLDEEQYFIEG